MNDRPYYAQPYDAKIFDTRIDVLWALAQQRMAVLRFLHRMKDPFEVRQEELESLSEKIYKNLGNNVLSFFLESDQNILSFWLCRFALNEDDDAEWLLQSEVMVYLVIISQDLQKSRNSIIKRYMKPLREENFPEHLQHFLPKLTEKLYIIEDFNVVVSLLRANKYPVINRCVICNPDDETIRDLLIADFIESFDRNTERCRDLYNDIELDEDFRQMLRRIKTLRYGSMAIQSVKQQIKSGLTINSLESLIQRGAIPMCAVRLFRHLQTQNKLKYQERLQLYTFLRDAGMPLEDSISLIKRYFCENNKMSEEKFSKEYEYNIKHVYGLVGAKRGAHCSGCEQYIQNVPNTGFTFGCPFRAMNKHDIEDLIIQNVRPEGVDMGAVLKDVRLPFEQQYYQSACQHLFHMIFLRGSGSNNPARYTQAALEIIAGDNIADEQ